MQDIEALTDKILLIGKGRILLDGSLDDLIPILTSSNLAEVKAKIKQMLK